MVSTQITVPSPIVDLLLERNAKLGGLVAKLLAQVVFENNFKKGGEGGVVVAIFVHQVGAKILRCQPEPFVMMNYSPDRACFQAHQKTLIQYAILQCHSHAPDRFGSASL